MIPKQGDKKNLIKDVTYTQNMVKILFDSLKIFYKDVNAKVDGVEGKMKEDTDDALNHRKRQKI